MIDVRASACAAAVLAAWAACTASPPKLDDATTGETRRLGMNDVTLLLPLPTDVTAPVIAAIDGDGAALVPRSLVDTLVFDRRDIAPKNGLPVAYDDFHLVAVRFDLCARAALGPCRDGDDGRLRLVLQPLYRTPDGVTAAHDIALHAFYPVPAAELAATVDELRALARLQDIPVTAPLAVNPALAAATPPPAYRDRLRALVLRHARADNLVRLTLFGQRSDSAAFAWIFRGVDVVPGGGVGFVTIPGLGEGVNQQSVLVAGGDTIYAVEPVADQPAGFTTAINGADFGAATVEQRRVALDALVALQNPTTHDTANVQCVGCHVATFLTARRAQSLGVEPSSLPGRYQSTYDLTVDTIAGSDGRVLRALGWAATLPAISQRVANDTAQTLTEIELRFPPPVTDL